jgi:hypothetical protein
MATKPALMAQSNGVRFALSQMLQRAPWSYPHQSQHKERVKVAHRSSEMRGLSSVRF